MGPSGYSGGYGTGFDGMMGPFGGLFMLVFWILILVGLVAFIVWAVREATAHRTPTTERRSALDVLDERYARGEIDHQEYEDRRQRLSSGRM